MVLSKSKKQIVYLYCSTIGGVLLGVLVSILNTRFLIPSEYGDVRYVNNIISFFSGIFLFGYFVSGSRLLALSESKEEASRIKGALVCILGITILLMMIVMLLSGVIHNFVLHKPYYSLFYFAIPVCGSTLLLNYINTSSQGDNSISTIAAARIWPQLMYLLTAFLVYKYFGATSKRMILIQNGIYALVLAILIFKNSPKFSQLKETFKKLNEENKKYGFQVYVGSLANVSVQYIAGMSLGVLSNDNTNVGFYTLALTVTTPLMMLPNVIGTTYFKQFAHQKFIPRKVILGTYTMSIVTLVGFCVLIFPIVDVLYNESYSNVALYASVLAIGFTMHGLGDVYNRFLGAHGLGKYLRNAAFISGGIALAGYTVGIYFGGITAAIITRILSSSIYFLVLLLYYRKVTTKNVI
ncbi:lipopolysaccharide biosynthesis protein [Marseilla massiliensis]|uniref:lipopolysaccharide biosynthesis protein n=1 Tax=Marseilla massiliensis TaxID=1841864 RepID=UPI002011F28D|nr:oligosaccharide flippase family protein [Marseilla massiliensis]MCL1610379.1 oligosaccharide flippase family protein [Marseilla massiliensis]